MTYFWFKMPATFFQSGKIKYLEHWENGDTIVLIYLKLVTQVLNTKGHYTFEGFAPTLEDEIAYTLGIAVPMLKYALNALQRVKLVIPQADGSLYLPEVPEMVGHESDSAQRTRKSRAKQKSEGDNNEDVSEPEIVPIIEGADSNPDLPDNARYLIDRWNHLGVDQIAKVRRVSSGSQRFKLLLQLSSEYGLKDIDEALDNILESPYLQGKNPAGWVIQFDWFLNPDNFQRVLEDQFLSRNPQPPNGGYDNISMMRDW